MQFRTETSVSKNGTLLDRRFTTKKAHSLSIYGNSIHIVNGLQHFGLFLNIMVSDWTYSTHSGGILVWHCYSWQKFVVHFFLDYKLLVGDMAVHDWWQCLSQLSPFQYISLMLLGIKLVLQYKRDIVFNHAPQKGAMPRSILVSYYTYFRAGECQNAQTNSLQTHISVALLPGEKFKDLWKLSHESATSLPEEKLSERWNFIYVLNFKEYAAIISLTQSS
jgi:hypothetical protein